MTKEDRLHTKESSMTHAMVISGVHLDASGRPVRYKVENSWGSDNGEYGYFVMTDSWFNEFVVIFVVTHSVIALLTWAARFVYQIVVHKALTPKDLIRVFEEGEMVVLPPWDPMVCGYVSER
jgi:bleomycin hydrolase